METLPSYFLNPFVQQTIPFGLNNIVGFSRSPLAFMRLVARKGGDLVPLRVGFYRVYFLNHPDFIRQVMVSEAKNYQTCWLEKQINAKFTGLDSLLFDDKFHREQREKVQPALHKKRISANVDSIVSATQQMLSRWQSGCIYNISQEMARLSLKITCITLFDLDCDDQIDAIVRATDDFQDIVQRIRQTILIMPAWLRSPGNRRSEDTLHVFDDLILKIIDKHRRGESRSHVLSELVGPKGSGLSNKQLRDVIFSLLLAGYATTATALTWMWALLAKHPDIEQRLLTELDATSLSSELNLEKLEELTFNEAVIRETLRLYPPIWLFLREANQDTIIGTQRVKKGNLIVISPYAIQHDSRFFPEPQSFKPERFLTRYPTAHTYIPFGAGASICVGQAFAMLTMQTVLATTLQHFRLIAPKPTRLTPKTQLMLRLKDELYLQVEAR